MGVTTASRQNDIVTLLRRIHHYKLQFHFDRYLVCMEVNVDRWNLPTETSLPLSDTVRR
jgi:hypothetical protein